MGLTVASTTEEDLLAGKLWTVQYTTGSLVATTGEDSIGLDIKGKSVIYQARTYTSTLTDCLVTLYEDTWSGGSPVLAANRNLNIQLSGPVSYSNAITGTPLTPRTSIRLLSSSNTGNANLGSMPEGEWYMLKANTKYILRMQNLGAQAGFLNLRFTYKAVD